MKQYQVRFLIEGYADDEYVVVVTNDEEDAEGRAAECVAAEYEVEENQLTWMGTSEYLDEPETYLLECPVHSGCWS